MNEATQSQKPPLVLAANRLYDDGMRWRRHQVVIPDTVDSHEKLLEPVLWRDMARLLKPLDVVDGVTDDGRVAFCLRVISVNPGVGATMKLVSGTNLGDVGAPNMMNRNTTGAVVIYRGPHRKWCVERGDRVLREEFETENDAAVWLAQHVRDTEPK